MFRSKRIKRDEAKSLIASGNYKYIVNFVSACFEDIYLYLKREGNNYCVVWYEENYVPGDNCLIHCDLKGFIDKILLYYDEDSGNPNEDDLKFLENARPSLYSSLLHYIERMYARVLRFAIEEDDVALEKALIEALGEEEDS